MEEIIECLKKMGYTFYVDENSADVHNDYLKILVICSPDESSFTVRYAILSDFDRWANSGFEKNFTTKEEVIRFLENEPDLLAEAMSEFLYEIIEEAYLWKKEDKDTILSKLEEMLQDYKDNI